MWDHGEAQGCHTPPRLNRQLPQRSRERTQGCVAEIELPLEAMWDAQMRAAQEDPARNTRNPTRD